jgi:predicted AAA+ superfamily ATPase
MFKRILSLTDFLRERSLFLFGPRQTGKTTLLRSEFPEAPYYNLLEADTFRDLAARPELIRQRLTGGEELVVVDEIQRLPSLLNEVQAMLDRNRKLRFVLTGSSARSLRRGGVNLLGGRARVAHLFPLVSPEVEYRHLDLRLSIGSLPAILESSSPQEELRAYVGTYLQEEIRAEGAVRSIESFSRFLNAAALCNGQLVNFTEVGSDAGVPPRTVREHFYLLEDTLLGALVEPYRGTLKRKPVATAKFYLFDVGVANHLMKRRAVERGSPEYGQALEHLVFLELRAYLSYRRHDHALTFWRSQSKLEVDFVVGHEIAIEVKAAERVGEKAMTGLRALAEEVPLRRKLVVCHERAPRQTDDGIEVLPLGDFLAQLWEGELL